MRARLVIAGLLLGACGSTSAPNATDDPAATAICRHAGFTGTVAGAFTLRAADLAQDEETGAGPNGPRAVRSSFRDYAPDTTITLCYFDGFIAAPGGPPPMPPATFRPYDRYVVTVDPSGAAVLRVAGHRDSLPVAPHLPS